MPSRNRFVQVIPLGLWGLTGLSVLLWSLLPSYLVRWDLMVYKHALLSLRAGHDPYADGSALPRLDQPLAQKHAELRGGAAQRLQELRLHVEHGHARCIAA